MFLAEHSETFQSISKHFVTSVATCCVLRRIDWAACVDLRTETRVSPAGRRSLTGGSAKLKPPPQISMAAVVRMPGQLHDARGSQGSQTAKRRAAGAALTAAGPS